MTSSTRHSRFAPTLTTPDVTLVINRSTRMTTAELASASGHPMVRLKREKKSCDKFSGTATQERLLTAHLSHR